MNTNNFGSLPDKRSAADSGLYGNGSFSGRAQTSEPRPYGAGGYSRADASFGKSGYGQGSYRATYDSTPQTGGQRQNGTMSGSGYPQTNRPPQTYDARAQNNPSAQTYRTNYNAGANSTAKSGAGAVNNPGTSRTGYENRTDRSTNGTQPNRVYDAKKSGNSAAPYQTATERNASGSAARASGGGKGGNGSGGNGNGSGNGIGSDKNIRSGKKPVKKKTPKQRFMAWLKRVLRAIYLFGKGISNWFQRVFHHFFNLEKPLRIFLSGAGAFVIICLIVIIAVSGTRNKRAEALAAELAMATPIPTIATSETPEPTPSPTPEVRIEKGAEGEDVMALQKRLMDLNYLAIDEPTSYFGHATKEAVKLFQRQHELQQDGICGAETIQLIYSEEAKPYVMYEGAEGDDIESFQEQLVELGYLESNQVTGYYGTDTVEAVIKFQNRNHLSKDGKAGEKTLEAINSPDARVSYTKEQEIIAEKKKQAALARASSSEGRIDKLISAAKKQLGDPYILGKSGPDSFDCSGLVVYCLRQANVYTRRLNAAGLSKTTSWTKVSDLDNVQRGDLLFFKSEDGSTIGHVGIYIGGGEMIDASSANGKVVRRGAKTSYWRKTFVVARRPIV